MIVADASVLLELLVRTPYAETAEKQLFAPRETLHAPYLLDLEIAQVLRRYAVTGAVPPERGALALADLADFPLRRYPHDLLLPRVWDLRASPTAYDAAYVALAEALDARLLTRNGRLARAPGTSRQD